MQAFHSRWSAIRMYCHRSKTKPLRRWKCCWLREVLSTQKRCIQWCAVWDSWKLWLLNPRQSPVRQSTSKTNPQQWQCVPQVCRFSRFWRQYLTALMNGYMPAHQKRLLSGNRSEAPAWAESRHQENHGKVPELLGVLSTENQKESATQKVMTSKGLLMLVESAVL